MSYDRSPLILGTVVIFILVLACTAVYGLGKVTGVWG